MNYIFRPPASSYDIKFTFEGLKEYAERGKAGHFRMLGKTLTFTLYGDAIAATLYETVIAMIFADGRIEIPEAINQHGSQATTYWVQKILTDNKIPGYVARNKGRYPQAGKTFERAMA